jgi:hypothetical protein
MKLRRRREERRKYHEPNWFDHTNFVLNVLGTFIVTVGFYTGNFGQFLHSWDVYFGGFRGFTPLSDAGANYLLWAGFCLSWFADNGLWNFCGDFSSEFIDEHCANRLCNRIIGMGFQYRARGNRYELPNIPVESGFVMVALAAKKASHDETQRSWHRSTPCRATLTAPPVSLRV